MPELKENLRNISKSFYSDEQIEFASELYGQVQSLKLDENSKITAFLMRADLSKEHIKKNIEDTYGKEIIQNIELLRRMRNIFFTVGSREILTLRKAFIELTDDVKIIIIKLAERLVALRWADRIHKDDVLKHSEECLYFYSPIAQMLGIRNIYNEMEDLSFKNLFPKDFAYLQKKISEKEQVYNSKISTIRNELARLLVENKIEARLQSRIKRPYSVYRKLKNKNITFDGIFDLMALRIITKSIENCYLVLGLVHSKWVPIEGRFRDWISYPKPNGYRSIQTTVYTRKGDKFEIQIRTEEMHEEAENGASAHWAYKQGGPAKPNYWIQSLKEFLEDDEYFENPYHFFEKLKSEMKRDYINVLTPKGEIISLPVGATPIDFAYSVHSDLGNHVTGAKINGKLVKLKTELKSGDLVDIISNSAATPSRDWLNLVKTSRSRSKILRWFKKNERESYIIQGKNSWERLKSLYKRKIQHFENEQKLRDNIAKIGYKNFDDFFFGIANGSVKCSLYLLKKLYPDAFKAIGKEMKKHSASGLNSLPQVRVEGLLGFETIFAKCCNPLKGEPIIAYITKKSEMKIHTKTCNYIHSENIDKSCLKAAEWLTGESKQIVHCKIFGDNFSKILTQLVNIAENESINILSTEKIILKNRKEGLLLDLEVKDISQFERLTEKIRASQNVESVKII